MSKIFYAHDDMATHGVKKNRRVFEALAGSSESIIIDMSKVEKIDGSGVGAVAHVKRSLNAKGFAVEIVNLSAPAAAVFSDLGLRGVLGVR